MRIWHLHIAILITLTYLVWSPALSNGFVWDDHLLIEKNLSTLKRFSPLRALTSDFWNNDTAPGTSRYYRPLVTMSFMADYQLGGLSPLTFHRTNILLHLATVLTLWLLLIRLGSPTTLALGASALWGVHPALAESVAWVSGRTDIMATLFSLVSLIAALRAFEHKKVARPWLIGAGACWLLALLSKESAVVTPIVAILLLHTQGTHTSDKKIFGKMCGVVAAVWLLTRLSALGLTLQLFDRGYIPLSLGSLSLLHIWGVLLWPPSFRIEYGDSLTAATLLPGALFGVLCIGWLLVILTVGRRSKVTRALALASLVAFIPAILVVAFRSVLATRLIYTSSAFALPALLLSLYTLRTSKTKRVVLVSIIALCALGSLNLCGLWRSDRVLFSRALAASDASSRNHLNLGIALYEGGDLRGALAHLSQPMEAAVLDQRHYMLSLLFTAIGCESLAEEELRRSLGANPEYFAAIHNLAGLLTTQGRGDEAQGLLQQFGRLHPSYRARVLEQIQTIRNFQSVASREPSSGPWCVGRDAFGPLFSSPVELNRIAGNLLKSGQLEMAAIVVRAALLADPSFVAARLNLAQIHLRQGQVNLARPIVTSILAVAPNEPRALKLKAVIDSGLQPRNSTTVAPEGWE